MPVVTTADFKAYKNISGTADDALFATLVLRAQAMMQQACDCFFDEAERTDTFNDDGEGRIFLPATPIASVASVSVVANDGNSTELGTTDYKFDAVTGELRFLALSHNVWNDARPWNGLARPVDSYIGFQSVTVTWTGGYADGTHPGDLKQAALELVDYLFARSKNADPTLQSESLGNYSYSRAAIADHTAMIDRLLRPYKRGNLL